VLPGSVLHFRRFVRFPIGRAGVEELGLRSAYQVVALMVAIAVALIVAPIVALIVRPAALNIIRQHRDQLNAFHHDNLISWLVFWQLIPRGFEFRSKVGIVTRGAGLGLKTPFDHLQGQEGVSLLPQHPAQAVDVCVIKLPVTGRRSLRVDQALALEEPDLRDGDVRELVMK
jgi:hypothetical protein